MTTKTKQCPLVHHCTRVRVNLAVVLFDLKLMREFRCFQPFVYIEFKYCNTSRVVIGAILRKYTVS